MKIKEIIKMPFRKLHQLFLWSSGADLEILNQVPTDQNKYFGIGGTILFTALMASFAGGYAFFTAFKSPLLSVFFGIFWGALIFNLDRYIVSTFGVGDGKKSISRQELIEAAPRLLMAIILGFVISTPLELKLFEKEINAEISTQISITNNRIIESGENDPVITRLRTEREELRGNIANRSKIIEDKRIFWENANKDKNDEWNLGKFSGKKGKGGYYTDLKKIADDAEKEYINIKKEYSILNEKGYEKIDNLDKRIKSQENSTLEDIENQKTVQAQNDGLLARLSALSKLTNEDNTLLFTKWLITILFIFIEIAPILFKMMTERGPYDDIVDRIKHEVRVNQLLEQSNINQEINMAVKLHTDKTEQKLNAELLANDELLKSIALAQAEIAKMAVEKWKEEQIAKITNGDSSSIQG
jgi:hypothetical protein